MTCIASGTLPLWVIICVIDAHVGAVVLLLRWKLGPKSPVRKKAPPS